MPDAFVVRLANASGVGSARGRLTGMPLPQGLWPGTSTPSSRRLQWLGITSPYPGRPPPATAAIPAARIARSRCRSRH
jgi:hypothetical protein